MAVAQLTFGGVEIPGSVASFALPPQTMQFKRTHFFGVKGVSQIVGRQGGRAFTLSVWLYDETDSQFDTGEKLDTFVRETINSRLLGAVATLQFPTPSAHQDMDNVTCEGGTIRPQPGIVQDLAGTLGGDFWAIVDISFFQLMVT